MSPPPQSMCCVPPSQYMLSFKVVRCPHPICSTHQECMCGVPPCNSVPLPHLALSWILSKVENLESSSLHDEPTDWLFLASYKAPVWLSILLNLYLRVWHSQLSLFKFNCVKTLRISGNRLEMGTDCGGELALTNNVGKSNRSVDILLLELK